MIYPAIRLAGISSYKVGRENLPIFHLFYADDVLIFTNGTSRSLNKLKTLLNTYERSSGQLVNIGKSSFYIGRRALHRVGQIE